MRLRELSVYEEIEAAVIRALDEGLDREEIKTAFREALDQYEEGEQ